MSRYLLRRVVLLVPTILGISVLVFGLMQLLPGDVVDALLGGEGSLDPQQRATLYQMLGLDAPLHIQFLRWFAGILHGDLGVSLRTSDSVTDLILARIPVTAELALLSVC